MFNRLRDETLFIFGLEPFYVVTFAKLRCGATMPLRESVDALAEHARLPHEIDFIYSIRIIMSGDTGAAGIWRLGGSDSAYWIFPDRPADSVNQVVDFLHVFMCDSEESDAELRISADTDFCVWLNGRILHGEQAAQMRAYRG